MKKRAAALLVCLCMLFSCAQALTFCAVHTSGAFLFDDTGALLCGEGEYTRIMPLMQGLFAAKAEGGWLVLDDAGQPLLEIEYEDVYAQEGLLYLKKDGLYAVADAQMNLITQHLYTRIVPNGEGGFLALKTDPKDDRGDGVYLIDENGNETVTGTVIVYGLNDFSCSLSPAVASGGKKTGYLGPDGKWAITAQYGYAAAFIEYGLAGASADSGAGVIDTQGNWVVTPKFESVSLSSGNRLVAVCAADGRVGLMDAETLEPVLEIERGYVRTRDLADRALITSGGQAALYAPDGSLLASWPQEEGASVRSAGEYLLLHTDSGEYLLDGQAKEIAGPYEKLVCLEEGVFSGEREGACDLILPGAGPLETQYESIAPAGEGLYLAWLGEAGFLIGRDGREIVKLARN